MQQVDHNIKFYQNIKGLIFYDWIVTVIFYTAVHYVDNFLDTFLSVHPATHTERKDLIIKNSKYFSKKFYYSFSRLLNDSQMARYQPDQWKNTLTPIRIKILLDDLENIKKRL